MIERAAVLDSVTTVAWARAALGWLMLRHDPAAARGIIDEALTEAQRIDYPIAVAVGLRSRAYAELIAGETAAAVASASDLIRDLLRRGALSNGRLLLDVTAAIAHRVGHGDWERALATARSLPITTLVGAQFEMIPLPPTSVPPVPRHDAIGLAWNLLAEMAVTTQAIAADASAITVVGGSIRRLGDMSSSRSLDGPSPCAPRRASTTCCGSSKPTDARSAASTLSASRSRSHRLET